MRYLVYGLAVVAFLVAIVFASINTDSISLDLAFAEVETTAALALLGFFAAGWVFGLLSTAVYVLKLLAERRQLRKSIRLADAEINSLRRIPDAD